MKYRQVIDEDIFLDPSEVNAEGFDLDELLMLITPETLHGDIDFGFPVGKEEF